MNTNPRSNMQLKVLISMYLGYGAMMLSRQMITILSPAMLADPTLSLTKTHIGDFAAYGTIGALVGKLLWGPITDKFGGRLVFVIGILLSSIFVIAFGFSPNTGSFIFFSFLVYCLKASGWPGLAKLISNWYHPAKYGGVWGILSTSSRASVVLGTLFFGWLLSQMHWRYVALTSALFSLGICVFCYFFMKNKPDDKNFIRLDGETLPESSLEESEKALKNLENHPLKETNLKAGLLEFAKSPRVWMAVTLTMVLTCLMAFLDFVSLYLMEVYQLTPSKAAMTSTVFPLGSLAGLFLCVFFYNKFSKKALRRVLTITILITVICIGTLKFLPTLGLGEAVNFNIALICIFFFALSIAPTYYIPMSIFSIEFGGPHSATLICLLDAFGFGASASFGFIAGRLADGSGGWDSFMNLILALSIGCVVSTWAFMQGEYRASLKA